MHPPYHGTHRQPLDLARLELEGLAATRAFDLSLRNRGRRSATSDDASGTMGPAACTGKSTRMQKQVARERYRRRCKMSSWVPVLLLALMWCFIPRVWQSLAAEAKASAAPRVPSSP